MSYTTVKQINESFIEMLRLFYKDLYVRLVNGDQNAQCTDIRCLYCDHLNTLRMEGHITDKLAAKATLKVRI